MNETKELGRIIRFDVGHGGRDDVMFGISVQLGGESWGTQDFKGTWSRALMGPPSEHAKWSETDRMNEIVKTFSWLDQLLKDAKVKSATQLVGKPIEATFKDHMLQSWRILTEVL